MTIKSRLFASVAVPFVSLPLILQPAGAMPNAAPKANSASGTGIILVQEQILPPDGQAQGEEQPETDQPRQEEREQPAAPEPEAPAPAPEPQAEFPAPEPEAPPPPATPEPEPEAAPAPEQEPSAAEPARPEEPASEPQPEPEAGETAPPAAPAPEPAPNAEQPAQDNAPEVAPAPESERQAEPTRRPDRQGDGEERPRGERPARSEPAPVAPQQGETQPEAPTQDSGETPAPVAPTEPTPVAPGEPAPTAPAPEEQAVPAAPSTPDEIRRAQEIARDPASAPEGTAVVLPVENGAAILDSAKEDGPRERGPERARGERPDRGQRGDTPRVQQQPAEVFIPQTDAEAQAVAPQGSAAPAAPVRIEAITSERGERIDRRPEFDRPRGWDNWERADRGRDRDRDRGEGRVIFNIDNRTVIRHDDSRRFYAEEDSEPYYERLGGGRVREVIERADGTQVVTIRNRYGEVMQRSRIARDGREYVLYYAPEREERGDDYVWRDPGYDLPPMRLTVPLDDYIIDTSSESDRDYYRFLEKPPVERVERVYSLDEVRYSARIRDKVRRIDLDTVTFATGSAEIPMNQARSLRQVAEAINQVLDKNPAETFLIEGHTDAVGSDESNLILSDERAESVASVLTDAFGIPPENMATQGYGERYLKVRTEAANQENRRVTIRRITPLVRPVAANN